MKIVRFLYDADYQYDHDEDHPILELKEVKEFISNYCGGDLRSNAEFIELVEKYANKEWYEFIDIPDEATDWMISEVYGSIYESTVVYYEDVLYVINGKIHVEDGQLSEYEESLL